MYLQFWDTEWNKRKTKQCPCKAPINKDTYICPPIFLSSQSTDQLLCSFYLYFGQFNVILQVLRQNSNRITLSQNNLPIYKQRGVLHLPQLHTICISTHCLTTFSSSLVLSWSFSPFSLSVIAWSSACFSWSLAICVANVASASSKLRRFGPTTFINQNKYFTKINIICTCYCVASRISIWEIN